MKKIRNIITGCTMLCMLCMGGIITESGFENPSSHFWRINNWAGNKIDGVWDTQDAYEGKYSLRMGLLKFTGKMKRIQVQTRALPLTAGKSYKLSFYIKGKYKKDSVQILISKGGSPYTVYYRSRFISYSEDWSKKELDIILPPVVDEKDVHLYFYLMQETTIWLDKVEMTGQSSSGTAVFIPSSGKKSCPRPIGNFCVFTKNPVGHNNSVSCAARSWYEPVRKITWLDPKMIKAFSELGAGALRFPSGRDANTWHWDKDRYALPFVSYKQKPDKSFMNIVNLPINCNHLDFIELCRRTGMDIYMVMNIFQLDRPSNIKWIQYLAEKYKGAIPVKHWELGNELEQWAMTHHNDQGLDNFSEYKKRAKPVADYIHKHHPGLMVAINTFNPYWYRTIRPREPEKARNWNGRAAEDNEWYDAIINHYYIHPREKLYKRFSTDAARWGFGQGDVLAVKGPAYARRYFGNKKIWVTEYGILGDHLKDYWFYLLMHINLTMQLLGNKSSIEVILHHLVLNSGSKQPLRHEIAKGKYTAVTLTKGWGTIFKRIHSLMNGAKALTKSEVPGCGRFKGVQYMQDDTFPNVSGICLEMKKGGRTYMLVNRSENKEKIVYPAGEWQREIYFAAANAKTTEMQVQKYGAARDIIMPAYSFLVLQGK